MFPSEELSRHSHIRTMSASSSDSRASAESQRSITSEHKIQPYNPLFSHPPLSLNTSPSLSDDNVSRWRDGRSHDQDHMSDASDYSPVKGKNDFTTHDAGKLEYMYDQTTQWPLKDWQTVPPGLVFPSLDYSSTSEEDIVTTPLRPRPANHQRGVNPRPVARADGSDHDVKRGAWKRRGIVFHLDSDAEEEQEQHYELPY
jgi:hypothetical protein